MIGIALGTLIPTFLVKVLLQPRYVCRHIGIPLRTYYWGLFGRSVVVAGLAAIAPWYFLLRSVRTTNLISLALLVILQGALALLMAIAFLSPEERKSVVSFALPARRRATQVRVSGSTEVVESSE
jgi:hypothetical protein